MALVRYWRRTFEIVRHNHLVSKDQHGLGGSCLTNPIETFEDIIASLSYMVKKYDCRQISAVINNE